MSRDESRIAEKLVQSPVLAEDCEHIWFATPAPTHCERCGKVAERVSVSKRIDPVEEIMKWANEPSKDAILAQRYRKALEKIRDACACDTPEVCYDVACEALSEESTEVEKETK